MRPNSPSPVVTVREHKITTASLEEAVSLTKEANASIGAKQFERAMQLRDPEFMEYHRTYRYLTTADHPRLMLSPENVGCLSNKRLIADYCCDYLAMIALTI